MPLTLRITIFITCLLILPLAAQDTASSPKSLQAMQQPPNQSDPQQPSAPPSTHQTVQAGQPPQPTDQTDQIDQETTPDQPAPIAPDQPVAQPVTQQPPTQPPVTPPPTQPDQPPTQPPGGVEPTPPIAKPTVQLPPPRPPARVTTERDTGGDVWSLEPFYWLAHSAPTIAQGHANEALDPGSLGFPGHSKESEGVVITAPTGHENSLEFTYFLLKGQGNSVLGVSEAYFGDLYAINDVLATNWATKSYKLSWHYLTYPYPSAGAKFRLKTLYEFQYASIGSGFNAPADVNAAAVFGTKSIIRPTFGLGIEYHPMRRVRFEASLSGIGLPHHGDMYDAEASLVVRGPHFEFLAGGKIFHLKTTPQADQYFTQTIFGPYAGLRLIWK